jgi:DNA-binding MarR family transcriptional regulator
MSNNSMIDSSDTAPSAGSAPADQTRLLLKSIRRIVRANDLQSRALAKATGLTGPQLVILTGVAELGEVTTQALADHADLSAATVVMVLDKLEQRAIVERYRSTSDRRIVYTRLTAKGAELVNSTRGLFGAGLVQRMAALPAARRQELIENLGAIADLVTDATKTVALD